MEVLSLRVTVNICCQFCSFVFSNQGSQLRNKQTGRGGYLKDKIHSRFIEHKERNDFSSTSTLPPKVLCFKCNQENFSRKGHSASASTTRLCQGTVRVQWGPQTSPRRTSQVHSHNGHTFQLKFHVICARHRVPLSSLQLYGDLSQLVGRQQAGFMGCSLCCPAFSVLGHSLPRVPLFHGGRKF